MDIHLINETRNVKIAKLKTAYTVFVHCNLVNNYKPCELTFFHIYIYRFASSKIVWEIT